MSLLDLQAMKSAERGGGHGGGDGSDASLLLCASEASVQLCL
jgi:Lanthionine-containing peptide SapB precursor RamS